MDFTRLIHFKNTVMKMCSKLYSLCFLKALQKRRPDRNVQFTQC